MSYKLLINGRLVEGATTLDVVNPATGEAFASCARADADQLEQAVAAASLAFPRWAAAGYAERGTCLAKLADALEARLDDLARTLTLEQGKPLGDARMEVLGAIATLRHHAAMELPLELRSETAGERTYEQFTPLGVVAAIAPWNFPLLLMTMKVAPALCVGNTMVIKPAPTTPLTTVMLGELAADILPPGVLNVIVDDNDLGSSLTAHPDVAMVSFTGSTRTGKNVMASSASTIKRLLLELGGNDAAIILDDAPVQDVAAQVFAGAMANAGQICIATKRIYAPRAIYDELCAELAVLADALVVDDGLKQGTQMGPLQNRQQFERVLDLIEDSRRAGKLVAGGAPRIKPGYFVAPTIVRDLPDDARLVREEQFGPVVPVLAYDDLDELVGRVNDSDYGLAGTVWTGDVERGIEVAKRIQSGTIFVNKQLGLGPDTPFGGAKQSGIGKSNGIEGLKEYTQGKIINVSLG